MIKLPFFLSATMLMLACNNQHAFEHLKTMSNAQWTYTDSLIVDYSVEDTSSFYTIGMDLDHSADYAYQNLYIQIGTRYPSGKSLEQTLSLDLASKGGEWHGQCSKQNCRLGIILQEKARFNEVGEHTFVVRQFMRTDTLEGIEKVLFFIDPLEPS